MAFFNLKKRCKYCGAVLDASGNCPNTECIAHQDDTPPAEEEDSK